MGRSSTFLKICLAADHAVAVGELSDEDLKHQRVYLGDHGHSEGFVGVVMSLITMEAAKRFMESVKTVEAEPTGNTVAEGLDMADRGEQF